MANCCRASGFVFKKEDKSEADRMFYIFTEEFGCLNVFARAIRKMASKLKSGIDIFSISQIEFIQGKNKKTLTDAVFEKKFENIKISPKKFKIANMICQSLDNFVKEQEKDKQIFNLLKECFEELNNNCLKEEKCDLIYYYFIWNLFSLLGFKPELRKCANCFSKLEPVEIYFSAGYGGTVCKKCYKKNNSSQKIRQDAVKILRIILEKDIKKTLKLKTEEEFEVLLEGVTNNYSCHIINK
jgi:DNA repair protein RecO (recombination protein O)